MTTSARIILDSVSEAGVRLTTMELEYPRFIHAETMTHRSFSRSASSSRAIPVERMIQAVLGDTAMPLHWGKNQPGMQAREEHDALVTVPTETGGCRDVIAQEAWLEARDRAIEIAEAFAEAGYHKQIVNRLLEPFMHIKVLVAATDWDNFFELRDHPDAQPEMQILARAMRKAMAESEPGKLGSNEFHLPYITHADYEEKRPSFDLIRASVARCARVSYLTHDGERPSIQKDIALYERLVGSRPLHASPAEHVAHPLWGGFPNARSRNFRGWVQHRVSLEEDLA